MKKKLIFSAMLVCLLALGLGLTGCSSDDDGDVSNNGFSLVGNWKSVGGGDLFNFTSTTFLFTIEGGFGTFSGPYTYTPLTATTANVVCNITNGTGFASAMIGSKYDVNIEWNDKDNFTTIKINSTSPVGGPSAGEKWTRQ
jgi:hypothetical protein